MIIGILCIFSGFLFFLLGLSSKSVLNLHVSELFDRHRWQNMTGLEDLSLVLLHEIYPIVHIILLHNDSVNVLDAR
jgi:hypothetical protein